MEGVHIAEIKARTQSNLRQKGFISIIFSHRSLAGKEVRLGTRGRN